MKKILENQEAGSHAGASAAVPLVRPEAQEIATVEVIEHGCTCIEQVNAKLADYNGLLVTNMLANPQRTMVSVTKLHERERRKPPLMEASHCPFCGAHYPKSPRDLAATATPQPQSGE